MNKEQKQGANSCRFNEGVACEKQECQGCGWNPEVMAARDAAIRQKLGISNKEMNKEVSTHVHT